MDRYELRREDYSLSKEQADLAGGVREVLHYALLDRSCPRRRARRLRQGPAGAIVRHGRNLARRAAWYLDNEPDERPELAASAVVFMAEEAAKAATMAVHIQGGLGVSVEAAATAYLVRARGWPLAAGDPGASAQQIAAIVASRA